MDDAEPARVYGPAVHLVESTGCGATWTGTAWAVDAHHLVTNQHVVANDATPILVNRDGGTMDGEVVGWSEDPDIAVIRVSETLGDTLQWALKADLSEGERVVALGYPAPANAFSVTGGSIVSFERQGALRPLIRSDSAVDKGNSGGPALTPLGQVAGVATAVDMNLDGLRMVSLIYTADALQERVEEFIRSPGVVDVDCDAATEAPDPVADPLAPGLPWGPGDDPTLDALYEDCADGSDAACDELYWDSAYGSEYESFALSCGGRGFAVGTCEGSEVFDGFEPPAVPDEPSARGDDADLDLLWDACANGDLASCDELFASSGWGTAYEEFGSTCGGTREESACLCVFWSEMEGEPGSDWDSEDWSGGEDVSGYGDDPGLDGYWDGCSAGDDQACRDLYFESPFGSDYEDHGWTCAGRQPDGMCW